MHSLGSTLRASLKCVVPDVVHIVPALDHSVRDRVGDLEVVSEPGALVADHDVPDLLVVKILLEPQQRSADHTRKVCPREVVAGETALDVTRSIIAHDGLRPQLFDRHLCSLSLSLYVYSHPHLSEGSLRALQPNKKTNKLSFLLSSWSQQRRSMTRRVLRAPQAPGGRRPRPLLHSVPSSFAFHAAPLDAPSPTRPAQPAAEA